ncbi:hypothetical protein AMAG_14005 [Allomyces macrogynus ATCC 38327]|uniref:G domain-containing protein n=1 Tax=Allomyces macrogynus (strain ATCC 38327) TaxID=578462 RepID=A0A0L0T2R7_ALLM3|nr:hypothetical protein AMAG_14005 [Allomyces macrogynus ATCC 38327]|eukprot:KNE69148.1 hypothetical protein AMAG_14005 [Allomyces macrogynus ATCC 38327]
MLINSIAGKIVSKAGVSLGPGIMFEHLQFAIVNGIKWVDTPGLADVKLCKKVAKGITKALQQPGHYCQIFVVTEQLGHTNPLDMATIVTVLNVINQGDIPFGVIFNKILPKVMKRVMCNLAKKLKLLTFINSGFYQRKHFYLVQMLQEPYDQDNFLCLQDTFVAPIKTFIDEVPTIKIRPEMVQEVDSNNLDKVAQLIEWMVANMMEQQQAQLEAMQQQHKQALVEMCKQSEQNRTLVEQHHIEAQEQFETAKCEWHAAAAEEWFHQAQLALAEQSGAKEAEVLKMQLVLEQACKEAHVVAEEANAAKIRLMKSQPQDDDWNYSLSSVILYEVEGIIGSLISGIFEW